MSDRLGLGVKVFKELVDLWEVEMRRKGFNDIETAHYEGGGNTFSMTLIARDSFESDKCGPWFEEQKS